VSGGQAGGVQGAEPRGLRGGTRRGRGRAGQGNHLHPYHLFNVDFDVCQWSGGGGGCKGRGQGGSTHAPSTCTTRTIELTMT
jgi:hypothetical protein